MDFRSLSANEIDVRIGQIGDNYCTLLLYKDARVDMDILDDTVGCEKWQRKHYEVKGNMYCSVGINVNGEWVWKDDCGTESFTEKEKGESSDSFKRACVNWGIGRELYTSPIIKVVCNTTTDNKGKKAINLSSFSVDNIIVENKVITGLSIKAYNKDTKTKEVVFSWGKSKTDKPFKDIPDQKKKMTLEEALLIEVNTKDGMKKLKDLSDEQLKFVKENAKVSEWKEGAELILLYKEGNNAKR